MSDKRTDFLWIVQMIMIKHQQRVTGWSGVAGDAVAASHRIPAEMTARDAALAFCSVFVEGFNGETRAEVPAWLSALRDPPRSVYEDRGLRSV